MRLGGVKDVWVLEIGSESQASGRFAIPREEKMVAEPCLLLEGIIEDMVTRRRNWNEGRRNVEDD